MKIKKDWLKIFFVILGIVLAIVVPVVLLQEDAMISLGYCNLGETACVIFSNFIIISVSSFAISLTFIMILLLGEKAIFWFGADKEPKQLPIKIEEGILSKSLPNENVTPLSTRFSLHLNEITKGEKLTYGGERFLSKMKATPPFLDVEQSLIHSKHERDLAEYFLAKEFLKTNKDIIRGGGKYRVKSTQDSFEKIAKDECGNPKYASQIKARNPGVPNVSTGQVIYFPYIDISDSLGLSSEQIEKKFIVAEDTWIEPTLKSLINQFSLIEHEALKLLKMVYDAAQKTRNEKQR